MSSLNLSQASWLSLTDVAWSDSSTGQKHFCFLITLPLLSHLLLSSLLLLNTLEKRRACTDSSLYHVYRNISHSFLSIISKCLFIFEICVVELYTQSQWEKIIFICWNVTQHHMGELDIWVNFSQPANIYIFNNMFICVYNKHKYLYWWSSLLSWLENWQSVFHELSFVFMKTR